MRRLPVLGNVGRRRRVRTVGSVLIVAAGTLAVAVVPASAGPTVLPADLVPLRYATYEVVNAAEQNSFTPAHELLGTFSIDTVTADSNPAETDASFPASYSIVYDGQVYTDATAAVNVVNSNPLHEVGQDLYNINGGSTRASDGATVDVQISLQDSADESMIWANGQRIVDLSKVTRTVVVFYYPASNTEDVLEVTVERLPPGGGNQPAPVDLSGVTNSLAALGTQIGSVATSVDGKASQTSVNTVGADVATTKSDVATIKANLAALKTTIDAMNAKLDVLLGKPPIHK